MMRKILAVAVVVLMVSALGLAGEKPAPEVFGGYQFTSTDGGWHANGFSTSANFYIWKSIGVTGDLGSGFSQGQSLYTYTVGPVISHQKGNFSPYVHALFGGAHAGAAGIGGPRCGARRRPPALHDRRRRAGGRARGRNGFVKDSPPPERLVS